MRITTKLDMMAPVRPSESQTMTIQGSTDEFIRLMVEFEYYNYEGQGAKLILENLKMHFGKRDG